MTRNHIRRGLAVLGAAAVLAAGASCGDDTPDILEPGPGGNLFQSYVAMGNSLTAGYQSGGLNDSTQRESYAYLLAQQAGAQFVYPSFPVPGCTPPQTVFLDTLAVVGAPQATPRTCTFRRSATTLSPLNNVAVPNAWAWDLTRIGTPTGPPNPLQEFILGGKTQLRRALDARPTFVSLWIGNNDVLAPASVGMLTPVAGASPGYIPPDTIIKYIKATVDTLQQSGTVQGGVLIGIVDVPNAPRFFQGGALFADPAFKAGVDAAVFGSGSTRTVTVLANCVGSTALVSSLILGEMKAGRYPPIISCAPATVPGVPPQAALGNLFVMSAEEQAALSAVVDTVNRYLQAKADTAGFAFYDPNNAQTGLPALKAAGLIPALPNFTSPDEPFGSYISLDGVHPRKAAHVRVANAIIALINAEYQISIPSIPTTQP